MCDRRSRRWDSTSGESMYYDYEHALLFIQRVNLGVKAKLSSDLHNIYDYGHDTTQLTAPGSGISGWSTSPSTIAGEVTRRAISPSV